MKKEPVYWSQEKRITFRFFFAFFALHLIPLSGAFWSHLFAQKGNLFFTTFTGVNYFPSFLGDGGYYDIRDFGLIAAASLGIALVWSLADKQALSYSKLYQWTRVILRYKLAAVLLVYAVIKIFPVQLPEPTISDLNTEYGDFTRARIFELTVGVAKAHYQTAVGLTELLAVILLFFRQTATLGAIVASGTLLNVVLAGFAYHTGAEFYALYLMLISVFLIAQDLPAMYSLLLEKRAVPDKAALDPAPSLSKIRTPLKGAFVLLALIYTVTVYGNSERSYLLPESPGLTDAAGLYDVSEFRVNNKTLAYSKTDTNRWKNVVFEKWNTLSIDKVVKSEIESKPVVIGSADNTSPGWESSGSAGRHYFSYTADEAHGVLALQNKNSDKPNDKLTLDYSRPDSSTIILKGLNNHGDSIYAVLKKLDKQYLLIKGRRKPVTL